MTYSELFAAVRTALPERRGFTIGVRTIAGSWGDEAPDSVATEWSIFVHGWVGSPYMSGPSAAAVFELFKARSLLLSAKDVDLPA